MEHVGDADAMIERWIEAFEMELNEDGDWSWQDGLAQKYDELVDRYVTLVRKWNQFVPSYNAAVRHQPIGRPLDASEAQCARVLKLHKTGKTIRAIVDETNLGMQTVRTIIGRDEHTDRSSEKRLERIDHKPVREIAVSMKARKRTRGSLPKQINGSLGEGKALLKEAKGLGR